MRTERLRYWPLVAILAALAMPGLAHAQETSISGELERTASTTPEEKREYAEATRQALRDAVKAVTRLAETARRENELELLEGLSTKLTALQSLSEVATASADALQAALAQGETERADHELRKLAVARTKAAQLLAEAEQLAGGGALRPGETSVTVEGGVFEEESELTSIPYDPFDIGYDAPQTSPFL